MTTPTIPVPVDVLRELLDAAVQEHMNDDDGRARSVFLLCGVCDGGTDSFPCNPYPDEQPQCRHCVDCPIPALREAVEESEKR